MATWTDPATIDTSPDSPVTSEFATAALENVEAFAEGASGSPVNPQRLCPYNAVTVGDGNDGNIWDNNNQAEITSPVLEAGYIYTFRLFGMKTDTGISACSMLLLDSGGSTIDTISVGNIPASGQAPADFFPAAVPRDGESLNPDARGTVVNTVRFVLSSDNFGAGKIYMYKKLDDLIV